MAETRFGSRKALRKAVEGHVGPLSEVEWRHVEPTHEPDYDSSDVQEIVKALVQITSAPERIPGLLDLLQGEPFARLVAEVDISLLLGRRSERDLERLGRLMLAVALINNHATKARQPAETVLGQLLDGSHGPTREWMNQMQKNAVRAITTTIAPRKARIDWGLYFRDREIDRELSAEILDQSDWPAYKERFKKWQVNRHAGPTAEQK